MNTTQSLLSTNIESFFSSSIMTTYVGFFLLVVILVSIDIYQTRGGNVTIRKAAIWSIFWFLLAFLFAGSIYLFWDIYAPNSDYTAQKATVSFITGYLLEKSLSVDNLFVFAIIFAQYQVPEHLRPRALLWGVIGALVLRCLLYTLTLPTSDLVYISVVAASLKKRQQTNP